MLTLVGSNFISLIIGMVVGAKLYKNRERLEEWARLQLSVVTGKRV
jgi:hypothetical protein